MFCEFSDKHVIVAGVDLDNIGFCVAEALLQLGARVSIIDKKADAIRLFSKKWVAKSTLKSHQADLSVESIRTDVLRDCVEEFGAPKYFVSTIGDDERIQFDSLTQEKMIEINSTNFIAPFFMAKDIIREMRKSAGGSVLMFTSHHATDVVELDMTAYSTSKAQLNMGIKHLAKASAKENSKDNIVRVNGFCPGWVWTPNQVRRFKGKRMMESIARQAIPIEMKPIGLVNLILSILSNEISQYVTGSIVYADGGNKL